MSVEVAVGVVEMRNGCWRRGRRVGRGLESENFKIWDLGGWELSKENFKVSFSVELLGLLVSDTV